MSIVIVPNVLRDAIDIKIDTALNGKPCDDNDRSYIFSKILAHFNEHGVIPDFKLVANKGVKA